MRKVEKVASKEKRPHYNLLQVFSYYINENKKNESLHANRSSKIIRSCIFLLLQG